MTIYDSLVLKQMFEGGINRNSILQNLTGMDHNYQEVFVRLTIKRKSKYMMPTTHFIHKDADRMD